MVRDVRVQVLSWWQFSLVACLVVAAGIGCRGADQPAPTGSVRGAVLGGVDPANLNVILITIDTLRADHVSCYGDSQVATPNIDRLASEGVRFTNAASTVPFTLPAHSSIMTGTYPPRHGIRENVGYFLGDNQPTIAESLKGGGRQTGGFVSAFVLDSRWGIARGFDHYFDDFDLGEFDNANLGSVQRPGNETVAEAVRWLDAREQSAPFFLWLHLYDPHDPYTPPEPYASEYRGRPYQGEVAFADSLIGTFRAALEERALLQRSLVILTADHGEGLGDHGEQFHGYFVYDTTIRVPLIIRFPGTADAGTVIGEPVSHVDLMPTILETVGLPVPDDAQGASLLPLIQGGAIATRREVYSESFYPLLHYGWAPLRSLRTVRYKLIAAPRPELFDILDDRKETHNLFAADPREAGELEARLQNLRHELESDAPAAGEATEIDQATIDRLRALGYMAGSGGISVDEEEERPRADPKDMIDIHQMIMATQSQIGRGEMDEAAALLNRVLERDPSIIDAHQMLGQIALSESHFDEAVDHYRQALALDGDHKTSLFGLAMAYRKMGRDADAIPGFEHLFDLSHRDVKVAIQLSELYEETGRIDDAAAILEEVSGQPDAPAMLLNSLGEYRVLQGRADEAAPLFERAIAINADLPNPYFNLAVLCEEGGDSDRAITLYESAIERAPKNFQAQFNLGKLYGSRGDVARQQAMWEAAIASNPDFARGYYYLAKLLMDRGDLTRAEELARAGIAKDTAHQGGPLGYFVLADVLNRTGRTAEAQSALAKGREIQRSS
jgi:arylsulfatase A-like enzyme/Flp pilus assembly protein TadD